MPIDVWNGDATQVRFQYALYGVPVENVCYINVPTSGDPGLCSIIADAAFSWYATYYRDNLGTSACLQRIVVSSMRGVGDTQFIRPVTSGGCPPAFHPSMPGNVTFCCSLRSGVVGRSARGRWYVVGVPEDRVSGNDISTTWASDILAALEVLRSGAWDSFSSGVTLQVYSRVTGGVPRSDAVLFPVLSVIATDYKVDSQVRRLGRPHHH